MKRILNKTNKVRLEWTVKKLVDNYETGFAIFDNAVQRGLEWDIEKKSRLIRSIILDDPIPPLYASKCDEEYNFIDGKQRSVAAITSFLHNEFPLEGLEPIEVVDTETSEIEEVDLNGKYFDDLDELLREEIKGTTLTIIAIDKPSEEKECEIFYNLNNGKPLSAMTVTRAKAKGRKDIVELGSHELFKSALTEKAFEKYTNEDIVVKTWAVLNEESPSLETKHIRPLMSEVEFSEADKKQIKECFDRVLEVHGLIEDKKIAKRLLTRTHMVSVMRVVWKSIQEGISPQQFMEWFVTFFAGKKSATISSVYNTYAGAGSAKKESVRKRLEELDKHFADFFNLE